jgi:hypothetical protein
MSVTSKMTGSLEAERATELLTALRKHILSGRGLIIGYIAAAEMIGLDGDHCRHVGQVVSRIDRACFDAGLPMLTLHWVRSPDGNVNGEAFNGSVTGVSKLWAPFNHEILDTAANFQWSATYFDLVQSSLDKLPKVGAKTLWTALETKIALKGAAFIRHNLHRRLRKVDAQTKTP